MPLTASQPDYRQQVSSVDGGSVFYRTPTVGIASATYQITLDGVSKAAGSATVAAITGGFELTVAVPSGWTIGEGYELALVPDVGSKLRATFDVVRVPYGPLVTIDDLEKLRPGIEKAIAARATISLVTSAQLVESIASRARAMLDDWVRDHLARAEDSTISQAEVILGRPRSEIYLRGYAILDPERLRRVERFLALYEYFDARKDGSDEDEDARLAASALGRAKAALRDSGRLRVDIDGDAKADAMVQFGRSIRLVRRQA